MFDETTFKKIVVSSSLGLSFRPQICLFFKCPLQANNTFLLALDGDVDFTPGAVRLLLDRMRKSKKVGASCGRIHPIGTGNIHGVKS